MNRIKTGRLIFCIAAMLFIAKPFIGFGLSRRLKSSVETNIFVKIFSKRKIEDGRSAMSAIQKQLAEPDTNLFLRFSFLLTLLFPLAFKLKQEVSDRYLNQLHLSLVPQQLNLFTGQLLI